MYRMHRVFCATAWELEGERRAFYDVIAEFNRTEAMRRGVLYVPVSLTNTADKRPYQYTIEENIRDCRHYILAVDEDWGPKERNFERDYRYALQCRDASPSGLREVRILLRNRPDDTPPDFAATLEAAGITATPFNGPDDFCAIVTVLLAEWLPADAEAPSAAGAA